ncbi:MAG TPA: MinD/ParA family protein, partial [Streptosporangiaceae bacterium]
MTGGHGAHSGAGRAAAAPDAEFRADLGAWLWPDRSGPGGPEPHRGRLLLPEDYLTESAEPPELGWQRLAFRLGARRVGPGRRELRHRAWYRLIRRSMSSPKVIAVFSAKGGVGKSTTAAELGHVLAAVRGEMIAALDANPDSGNLVKRVREPYSVFSAVELGRDASRLARHSDILPYVTQADSGLSVIRSDPAAAARLGPGAYQRIVRALSRFYLVIIADLGTGIRDPAFLALMEAADGVVAVTEPTFDAAEVVIEGIDWLGRLFPAKIGAGTVVLNGIVPGRTGVDVGRLAEEFGKHMARVARVPWDRHLATGGVPQWPLLARHTQDAYLQLAAAIIDGLPDQPGTAPDDTAAPDDT